MMHLLLSQGKIAKVCDCHYQLVWGMKWHYKPDGKDGYAQHSYNYFEGRKRKCRTTRMHRIIARAMPGEIVDHINRDKLDNRCSNLRIVTFQQNIVNRGKQRNNTSGYTGVQFRKDRNKWMAIIGRNGSYRRLGSFDTPEEAHTAYQEALV